MSIAPIHQSRSFYFTLITFQVEDTLFQVPRHYFEQESQVFRDVFQLPVPQGTEPDGTSHKQPLHLEGVTKEDFEQLLRVMFPKRLSTQDSLTLSQWTSVLNLSALWQMDALTTSTIGIMSGCNGSSKDWMALLDLSTQHNLPEARALAIRGISATFTPNTESVWKISLAKKYKVRSWLLEGLRELVGRKDFFSDAEGDKLGLKMILRLCRIRESLGHVKSQYRSADIRHYVEKEFRSELSTMLDDSGPSRSKGSSVAPPKPRAC